MVAAECSVLYLFMYQTELFSSQHFLPFVTFIFYWVNPNWLLLLLSFLFFFLYLYKFSSCESSFFCNVKHHLCLETVYERKVMSRHQQNRMRHMIDHESDEFIFSVGLIKFTVWNSAESLLQVELTQTPASCVLHL